MPSENTINQISKTWENISSLNIEQVIASGNFSPWNDLTGDDYLNAFGDLRDVMESAIEQDSLRTFPYNIVNSLQGRLNNVLQQTQQFINSKDQSSFQNSLSQIEGLRTNLRTWGLHSFVTYGQEIESKVQSFDTEYNKILERSKEIQDLKSSVENLIKPAVAGSLSKAFSDRQEKLTKKSQKWFWAFLISGIVTAISTALVLHQIIDVLTIEFPESATNEQIESLISKQPSSFYIQFLRAAILFPLVYLFGLSFSQYKKERNLEEEYAHRSAVSTSLPNYGDLAGDPKVKDQIISSATEVIFTTPIDKRIQSKKSNNNMTEVKQLIDSLGKLLPQNNQD